MPTDIAAARAELTEALDYVDANHPKGAAGRIRAALDYLPADDYEPEHARPEPVATEREWLDKIRQIIANGWMPNGHDEGDAYGRALETIDRARADLAGQPATIGARRALQSIVDMLYDDVTGWQLGPGVAERVLEVARDGLASIEQAADTANRDADWLDLTDEKLDRLTAATWDPAPTDATIEALRLPGDRFMLILSGWPTDAGDADSEDIAQKTGAAHVLVTPFPVSTL